MWRSSSRFYQAVERLPSARSPQLRHLAAFLCFHVAYLQSGHFARVALRVCASHQQNGQVYHHGLHAFVGKLDDIHNACWSRTRDASRVAGSRLNQALYSEHPKRARYEEFSAPCTMGTKCFQSVTALRCSTSKAFNARRTSFITFSSAVGLGRISHSKAVIHAQKSCKLG